MSSGKWRPSYLGLDELSPGTHPQRILRTPGFCVQEWLIDTVITDHPECMCLTNLYPKKNTIDITLIPGWLFSNKTVC